MKKESIDFKVIGNKKVVKEVEKWLKEIDVLSVIKDLYVSIFCDNMIYGYSPWDYARELELNLNEQGFTNG